MTVNFESENVDESSGGLLETTRLSIAQRGSGKTWKMSEN
jgi:hypothetical protein